MEKIKNYKLKEFLRKDPELINQYLSILQFIEPIQTKKEVVHMKLKHVEMIKENISNGGDEELVEIISKVQKVKKKEVYEFPIIQFFGIMKSVRDQIEKIVERENNNLNTESNNMKWIAVNGSERLAKFGIFNTCDTLAKGDILKYKEIMNLKYSDVFVKLLLDKVKADLEIEMNNIKTI